MSENIPGGNGNGSGGADDKVAYETYTKVLGEKKKLQEELKGLSSRLEQIENEKLQAEGQWKEVAEKNKKLAEEMKSKNVNLIKSVSERAIKSQFLREAEKLGCLDADLAYKAISFEDLEVTEDFEFDGTKLVSKIQELTKAKPHLFKKDFNLPPDVTPKGQSVPSKALHELSEQELKQMLATAK